MYWTLSTWTCHVFRYIPEGLGCSCGPDWYTHNEDFHCSSYVIFLMVTCFIVPLSIIVFSYSQLLSSLRAVSLKINQSRFLSLFLSLYLIQSVFIVFYYQNHWRPAQNSTLLRSCHSNVVSAEVKTVMKDFVSSPHVLPRLIFLSLPLLFLLLLFYASQLPVIAPTVWNTQKGFSHSKRTEPWFDVDPDPPLLICRCEEHLTPGILSNLLDHTRCERVLTVHDVHWGVVLRPWLRACCPLTRRLIVRSLLPPVQVLKRPWPRHLTVTCTWGLCSTEDQLYIEALHECVNVTCSVKSFVSIGLEKIYINRYVNISWYTI